MIRRPPRSTRVRSSAASDVYKRQRGAGTGQEREGDVVLEHLAASLAPDRGEHLALVGERDLTGLDAFDLEVVGRDAPLEQCRHQRGGDRVAEVARAPR